MQKYNYTVTCNLCFDWQEEMTYLKGMAESGWELVSVIRQDDLRDYYWKQQLPIKIDPKLLSDLSASSKP